MIVLLSYKKFRRLLIMKKITAILAALFIGSIFAFADPAEGYWISYDEKSGQATAGWYIYQKDGKLFGTMTAVHGEPQDQVAYGANKATPKDFPKQGPLNEMVMVGTDWIYNLVNLSEGVWGKGNIVDPGDGSKYTCKITFHAADSKKYDVDTLEMRGSLGPIGRSQYWKKATEEEARAIR